jgi:hypothetical protein
VNQRAAASAIPVLQANSRAYEWLVSRAQAWHRRDEVDHAIAGVQRAATFAANFHAGRFADGAIENIVLELGSARSEASGQPVIGDSVVPSGGTRRVLHVASDVLPLGGHTRMLFHWVRNDRSSRHSLVLLRQGDGSVPGWLVEAIAANGGQTLILPERVGMLEKARVLRQASAQGADLVILHHAPGDAIPTLAFAEAGGPPVAVLNHADHVFWLGSAVADIVVNLRSVGAQYCAERRYAPVNVVLPVPLRDPSCQPTRAAARAALGIADQIVLLSVARAEKFWPCGDFDFVATAGRILARLPNAWLFVVGESAEGIARHLRAPPHERIRFLGPVENPAQIRAAADVYLETFPFGSQTALLEAALLGLAPVPAYAPLAPVLVANDDALGDLLPSPDCEEEYIERVVTLARDRDARQQLGRDVRERLLRDHVDQGWLRRLAAVYGRTDALVHRPRPIPVSACSMRELDLGLAWWQQTGRGGRHSTHRHAVYVARRVGDYAQARRAAVRGILAAPGSWSAWRQLAAALLGPAAEAHEANVGHRA